MHFPPARTSIYIYLWALFTRILSASHGPATTTSISVSLSLSRSGTVRLSPVAIYMRSGFDSAASVITSTASATIADDTLYSPCMQSCILNLPALSTKLSSSLSELNILQITSLSVLIISSYITGTAFASMLSQSIYSAALMISSLIICHNHHTHNKPQV